MSSCLSITSCLFVTCLMLVSCQEPTNACFTHSVDTSDTAKTYVFDASCSQNAFIFRWSFGDGSPDSLVSDGYVISHTFPTTGSYTVSLNAARKDGIARGISHPTYSETILVQ